MQRIASVGGETRAWILMQRHSLPCPSRGQSYLSRTYSLAPIIKANHRYRYMVKCCESPKLAGKLALASLLDSCRFLRKRKGSQEVCGGIGPKTVRVYPQNAYAVCYA
eukprot:1142005-Amphidinium_carterae.1